jgi:hypothetical protein
MAKSLIAVGFLFLAAAVPAGAAPSSPSLTAPPGYAPAIDGCAPIIASVSPSGAIVRDGNNLRFDAKVLCGGLTDITNDPQTKIGWSVAGGIGNVNPLKGNGTTFSATNPGSGQVAAYVQYYTLTAEARADVQVVDSGSCNTITVSTFPPGALVPVGQGKQFRMAVHCNGNNITGSAQLSWSVSGGIGYVNPTSGSMTNFTASNPGPGRVNAGVHYGNQNLGGHSVVVVSGTGGGSGPYITGTVPVDGATGVLRNASVQISFSAPMNSSATQAAISANPGITGTFSWPDTARVVWTPTALLAASTKYTVSVDQTAKSQAGQQLAREHVFNFTTGTAGDIAPAILSTNPADGAANVPLNTTIVFEWNQDMQRATAEGATSASPAISGTWQWNPTDTMATWTPGAPLQQSTQYTVDVNTNATSQNGGKMQSPYTFKFTTGGPPPPPAPAVVSTDPANNQTGVLPTATVSVEFSIPMNTGATETAVSANPAIAGTFSWSLNDSKATLTPSGPLQPATNYKVKVSTAAKSKAGVPMGSDHVFSFTTAEPPDVPQVVSNSPTNGQANVPVATDIVVVFSIAMSRADTAGALSVTPAAPGALTWDAGDTKLTLNPSPDLQAGTKYTVRITTSAKSAQGVALPSEHVFDFTTASGTTPVPPKVVATNPNDGAVGVPVFQLISLTFDQAMDKPSTEAAFSIAPGAAGNLAWDAGAQVLSYDTMPDLQYGTTYTVTVSTAAKSAQGAPLPAAFSFKFTTAEKDNTPPAIVHVPPGEVDEGTAVEISATVTDASGVASVTLLFRPAGQAGFTSASMAKATGDEWKATVPAEVVKPAKVEYYIQAADEAGSGGNSPPAAPDALHAFSVRAKDGGPGPNPGGVPGGSVKIGGLSVPVLLLLLAVLAIVLALAVLLSRRRRKPQVEAPPGSFFDAGARVAVAQPTERVEMPAPKSPAPPDPEEGGFEPAVEGPRAEESARSEPGEPGATMEPGQGQAGTATAGAAFPARDSSGPVERDESPEAMSKERDELRERIRAKRAARTAGRENGNGKSGQSE